MYDIISTHILSFPIRRWVILSSEPDMWCCGYYNDKSNLVERIHQVTSLILISIKCHIPQCQLVPIPQLIAPTTAPKLYYGYPGTSH